MLVYYIMETSINSSDDNTYHTRASIRIEDHYFVVITIVFFFFGSQWDANKHVAHNTTNSI